MSGIFNLLLTNWKCYRWKDVTPMIMLHKIVDSCYKTLSLVGLDRANCTGQYSIYRFIWQGTKCNLWLTARKNLRPLVSQHQGTKFCQYQVIFKEDPSSIKPWHETATQANICVSVLWNRGPIEAMLRFLIHRNCEAINTYCFELLSLW